MLSNYQNDISEVRNKIIKLMKALVVSNEYVLDGLKECCTEKFEKAREGVRNASSKINSLDNDIIKILALHSPEARDLREIVAFFKLTNEILRAHQHTRSFIKNFMNLCGTISQETINEYLVPLHTATLKAIKLTAQMLEIDDVDELQDKFHEVVVEENKTDDLYSSIEQNIIETCKEDYAKINQLLKSFRKSEKIADRAINMANLLLYSKIGGELQNI
jgi:phosphate transport system protein